MLASAFARSACTRASSRSITYTDNKRQNLLFTTQQCVVEVGYDVPSWLIQPSLRVPSPERASSRPQHTCPPAAAAFRRVGSPVQQDKPSVPVQWPMHSLICCADFVRLRAQPDHFACVAERVPQLAEHLVRLDPRGVGLEVFGIKLYRLRGDGGRDQRSVRAGWTIGAARRPRRWPSPQPTYARQPIRGRVVRLRV